jgi:hypothetical protein
MTLAGLLLSFALLQDAKVVEIREPQPCNCSLRAERLFRIGERSDAILAGRPKLVVQDRLGRLYIINIRRGGVDAPPEVFDSLGRYLGPLGRRGQGPGETTLPYWLDAGFDDTIRVFEPNRVVMFGPDLKHTRTRTEQQPVPGIRHIVMWPNGSYFAIGYRGIEPGQSVEWLYRRSPDGTNWAPVPEAPRPYYLGPGRIPRPARVKTSGRLWLAQYAAYEGHGFDLLLADSTLRVRTAMRHQPSWWVTAKPAGLRELVAFSRVVDVRDLGAGLVAVLIAQPRPDWRRVPVDPVRLSGWWNFYTTLVEVLDSRRNLVVGVARFPGYPQRILSDTRVATYVEEDDVPLVDIWKVQLRTAASRPNE